MLLEDSNDLTPVEWVYNLYCDHFSEENYEFGKLVKIYNFYFLFVLTGRSFVEDELMNADLPDDFKQEVREHCFSI